MSNENNYEINKTTFDVYACRNVGFHVCRNSVYLVRNILTWHCVGSFILQYQVIRLKAFQREKYHPSPPKNKKTLFSDSSPGSINSSKSNDSHQSLKSSDSPDLKHPSPMIEGIDLITSENAKQFFECDKHKYSSKTHLEGFRQLMISHGMDPGHVAPPTSASEGTSRSSSSSSSSSGSSSTSSLGISSATSALDSSSAIGTDVSRPIPECAAGKNC